MCGIAGFHIKPKAKGKVRAGYLMDWLMKGIENRGIEATGFISVGFDNQVTIDKAALPAMEFIPNRKAIKSMPQTVLAHTRLATQGSPAFPENNHPVAYGTVFVTHNGWIINDNELLAASNLERTAEVDTIAIPAMLWNYNETGFQPDSVTYALEQLQGAMALAAVDITQPGELLLARGNNSPLAYFENENIIIWASTIHAIQQAWGKVFGTPPARKRFKEFQEGEFRLIKNGIVTHEGTFKPTYVGRYTWGYSSFDDEDWYTKEYTDANTHVSASGGTWISMPDGSRTWLPTDQEEPKETTPAVARPSAKDIDSLRAMGAWAKIDAEAHENTIYTLSNDLQIPMVTVAWLRYYVDEEVVKANPFIETTQEYLESRYSAVYEQELVDLLDQAGEKTDEDQPPAPQVIEGQLHKDPDLCPECEEVLTGGVICPVCVEAIDRLTRDIHGGPPLLTGGDLRPAVNGSLCIRCDEEVPSDLDFYCGPCIVEMSVDRRRETQEA